MYLFFISMCLFIVADVHMKHAYLPKGAGDLLTGCCRFSSAGVIKSFARLPLWVFKIRVWFLLRGYHSLVGFQGTPQRTQQSFGRIPQKRQPHFPLKRAEMIFTKKLL